MHCDDINPWTYRNDCQDGPTHRPAHLRNGKMSSLPLSLPLKPTATTRPLPPLPSPSIHDGDLHYSKRVLRGSGEGYEQALIQKGAASYKIMSFEFGCRGWQQKRRDKHLPFTLKTLRQFTEGMTVHPRKQTETTEYQKALRVKRYFTEEKDYEDEEQISPPRKVEQQQHYKIEELAAENRTEEVRRKREGQVKVVKLIKNSIPREEVVKGGRLFEQINQLCEAKASQANSGHLSLMKRNYNLKKLEKLLKGDSFTLRNKH